jgi:hypothetical protein
MTLKVGTLCTIRRQQDPAGRWGGYWVVTDTDQDDVGPVVRAFSLSHQYHHWFLPNTLKPVEVEDT